MSYSNRSFLTHSSAQAPSVQNISTTYTEITGSKGFINLRRSNSIVYYKFCFYFSTNYFSDSGGTGSYDKPWLHIKLQKSNDNFVSDINDVAGTFHNVSGDTIEARDYYFRTCTPMFLVQNMHGSSHLRLVARSYSTDNEVQLHRASQFDGDDSEEVYLNTALIIVEIEV